MASLRERTYRAFHSVRFRLVLVVLVAALPAAGLSFHLWGQEREAVRAQVRSAAGALAQQISLAESGVISLTKGLLVSLATNEEVRSLEPERVTPVLRTIEEQFPTVSNLGLILADGSLVASALPARRPMDLSDRDYFQRALHTGDLAAGTFQIGRITGRPGINFGFPVLDDTGKPVAVIFAALDLATLERSLIERFAGQMPAGSTVVRMDENGTVLGQHPESGELGAVAPALASLPDLWRRGSGITEVPGPDGIHRIYALSSVENDLGGGGVRVLISIPTSVAYASADQGFSRTILFVLTGTLLCLAGAWLIGRRSILRPLHDLALASRRLAEGERELRLGSTFAHSEFGDLASAFDEMTQCLARREENLRRSGERFRELVRNAPYGIFRSTIEGSILDANPALLAILGLKDLEEARSLHLATDVYRDPRDREKALERSAAQEWGKDVLMDWKRRDGSPITVRVAYHAVRDEAGDVQYIETFVEDITETRLLEEQLRHAQKMEAVGRLASGVAHDFNNILTSVMGQSARIMEKDLGETAYREAAAEVMKAAERATRLTRKLLLFGRKEPADPRPVSLNQVVDEMAGMLERLLGEQVHLVLDLESDVGLVRADRGSLEQVVMNLAVNARDAMPEGGRLRISTGSVELDEAYTARHLSVQPGPYLLLSVSDEGVGMDPATRSRIFEPFFTTKEQGKGTGLGLSTTFAIVRQHGGSIWVYSEVGRGTTFKIYLPCIPGDSATAEASPSAPPKAEAFEPPAGSETILIAEDDEGVRSLMQAVLEETGYRVHIATTGSEAEALADERGKEIDLFISDLVLPDVQGTELAARIRKIVPGVPAMFMSGYHPEEIERTGLLDGQTFLEKPFSPDDLNRAVREALGAGVVVGHGDGEQLLPLRRETP